MKKRLLTILITSLVMIGLLGGFLWKMSSVSRKIAKDKKELLQQELDLDQTDKAWKDVNELDIVPLYLSGTDKNVVTKDYSSLKEIYNTDKSAAAEELLTDIKKKGDFTTKKPLWAYNPYGTNNNSLYLYFKSEGKCYCRYTISVKQEDIPDFTRTLSNGASGNVSEEHEYQIIGLVPGQTNYIILKLYNSKDELSRTMVYKVDMPKSQTGAQLILDSETGRSKVNMENGLYTVFQAPVTNKETVTRTVTKKGKKRGKTVKKKIKKKVTVTKKKSAVLLYDNSGVLRGEIPVIHPAGNHAEIIYDHLVYAYDTNCVAQVNSLGQVVGVIDAPNSYVLEEFAYDGYGSLYAIASSKNNQTPSDRVIKITLDSGEVTDALRMEEAIPSVYEKENKKHKNWIGLDSIQVVGTNQLLLSSSKLSSVFKISNVNSLMPKLDYIIADKDLWKGYRKLKKKVLAKSLPENVTAAPEATPLVDSILDTKPKTPDVFESQYGQNALVIDKPSSLEEGQYYLYLLNNNAGKGAVKGNKNSYYYKYLVDETAGTYILAEKERLDKNVSGGNVTPFEESYLYCISDKNRFLECDTQGKLIKFFQVKQKLYRVYKDDWKGFWFY
ncbi:MAG: aryl-sulfate sulfotransferase [Lachnospiraceae bacterium]|nr:aryl-sulfate sulfotransferase [Lachnospiraceae bacterium]